MVVKLDLSDLFEKPVTAQEALSLGDLLLQVEAGKLHGEKMSEKDDSLIDFLSSNGKSSSVFMESLNAFERHFLYQTVHSYGGVQFGNFRVYKFIRDLIKDSEFNSDNQTSGPYTDSFGYASLN